MRKRQIGYMSSEQKGLQPRVALGWIRRLSERLRRWPSSPTARRGRTFAGCVPLPTTGTALVAGPKLSAAERPIVPVRGAALTIGRPAIIQAQ